MQQRLDFGPQRKRCSDCGESKPLDQFHRNRRMRDGRQSKCQDCNIEVNKRWYREHPEARDRLDEYARMRRLDYQRRVLEYLRDHPCVDCGETDPVLLDFDHLRDKTANVSAMRSRPWWRVLEEIEKCEVVCANCHRRRTAKRLGSFRYLNGLGPTGTLDESGA